MSVKPIASIEIQAALEDALVENLPDPKSQTKYTKNVLKSFLEKVEIVKPTIVFKGNKKEKEKEF